MRGTEPDKGETEKQLASCPTRYFLFCQLYQSPIFNQDFREIKHSYVCATKQQANTIQISQATISWFYGTPTWKDLQKGDLIYDALRANLK